MEKWKKTRKNKFIFEKLNKESCNCRKKKLPGNTSGLRARLISNGGWGYNRSDSATISLIYLKTYQIYQFILSYYNQVKPENWTFALPSSFSQKQSGQVIYTDREIGCSLHQRWDEFFKFNSFSKSWFLVWRLETPREKVSISYYSRIERKKKSFSLYLKQCLKIESSCLTEIPELRYEWLIENFRKYYQTKGVSWHPNNINKWMTRNIDEDHGTMLCVLVMSHEEPSQNTQKKNLWHGYHQ